MKLGITLIVILFALPTRGQHLTALLMGDVTHMPLANAKVTAGKNMALSSPAGIFSIDWTRGADSIRITCAGYAPYAFKPVAGSRTDTLVIYLNPIATNLREVRIKGKRNLKADSLRLRKEFGAVFNYKALKLSDALVHRPPPNKTIPYDYITAPNNATSIVGVNLLSVASLLSKNKNNTSHLQSVLLKEEAANYTDQTFSRQKVSNLTSLQGDSLQKFMDKYRPGIQQLKTMSDYELISYIKKSYASFAGKKQ